jgi:lysophospholipase L1-like esterase
MHRPFSLCLVAAVLVATASFVGCSPTQAGTASPAGSAPPPVQRASTSSAAGANATRIAATTATLSPEIYVAVGDSMTAGQGADDPASEAWPVVLSRSLPPGSTFLNLGIGGATVADATARELPSALAQHPTLVTVWLGINDLANVVPVATYEQRLADLVHRLRADSAPRLLLANIPPFDHLPAYTSCLPDPPAGSSPCVLSPQARALLPAPGVLNGYLDAYNAAVAEVAEREGAVLVDVHQAALQARSEGREASLVSADGFHPSVAGHRELAAVFAAALGRPGRR